MKWLLVGLGNPGVEYEGTRHNVGRMVLEQFRKTNKFNDWSGGGKGGSLRTNGKFGKHIVELLLPQTYMNKSGLAVSAASEKLKVPAERVVVVYDDIDLPLGILKLSFNRGSGGHRGVDSVIKKLKTREFTRVRVGVAPTTPSGKMKKPKGEKKVLDHLMKGFTKREEKSLNALLKLGAKSLGTVVEDGRERAMNTYN